MENGEQPQNDTQVVLMTLRDMQKSLDTLVKIGYYNKTQGTFLEKYLLKFDDALKVVHGWDDPATKQTAHDATLHLSPDSSHFSIDDQCDTILREQRTLDNERLSSYAQLELSRLECEKTLEKLCRSDAGSEASDKSFVNPDFDRYLFFRGLHRNYTEEHLDQIFGKYGEVRDCQVEQGVGVVKMTNAMQAVAAMNGLHGSIIAGRRLSLEKAPPFYSPDGTAKHKYNGLLPLPSDCKPNSSTKVSNKGESGVKNNTAPILESLRFRDTARNCHGDIEDSPVSPFPTGHFGRALLEKMGWKDGEGLGPDGKGSPNLISPKVNNSTAGLGVQAQSELYSGSATSKPPVSKSKNKEPGGKQTWDMAATDKEFKEREYEQAVIRRAIRDTLSVRTRKTKGIIADFLEPGHMHGKSGKPIKFTSRIDGDFKLSTHPPGAVVKVVDSNTCELGGITSLYREEQLDVMDDDILELMAQQHKHVLAYNRRTKKTGRVRIAWINVNIKPQRDEVQRELPEGHGGSKKSVTSPGPSPSRPTDNEAGSWLTATDSEHTLNDGNAEEDDIYGA